MKIIAAFNERPESRHAVEWVLTNGPALARGSGILEVHVVLTSRSDSPASPNNASPTLGDAISSEFAQHEITATVHRAESDAAEQIVDLADSVNADLVVIGMRRRSATLKILLGSQVQRVLLDAPCPVVTVKVDERADA